MESYLLDWANLLLRWVHVITAIAWIGSSFYFVFLDSSLTPPEDDDLKKQGVSGELWAVHGGGFYHPVKFNVAPPQTPRAPALVLLGELQHLAERLLAVHRVLPLERRYLPGGQVAHGLGARHGGGGCARLSGGVLAVVRRHLPRVWPAQDGDAIVGALVLVLVCIASWLACHWFAGRAAFLLVGAMMATAMSANVFFWIIPGQRTVVADLKAGRPVDPIHGKRGKQRSVHNTYFTLPVLFAMLSGHYSFTWSHPQNWLVLILMMFAGAAIRQFFVMRHGFKLGRNAHPWPYALVGVVVIVGAVVWLRPAPVVAINSEAGSAAFTSAAGHFDYAKVQAVLQERCVQCHGPDVQMKGVRLDSAQQVAPRALLIYQQVVLQKLMPMNNATQMTDAERDLIARWHAAGAPVQ